jgi:hypothetical protein
MQDDIGARPLQVTARGHVNLVATKWETSGVGIPLLGIDRLEQGRTWKQGEVMESICFSDESMENDPPANVSHVN